MFLMEQSGQTPVNSKIKQKHTPGQSEQPNRQPHPNWRFGKVTPSGGLVREFV